MALIKVNVAIAALIEETAMSTVDKLVAFLGEKLEIDEDMQQMFADFKATLKVTPAATTEQQPTKKKPSKKAAAATSSDEEKPAKAKRAPSAYNMYLSAKIAELKAQGAKGNLMKLAIEAWKASKDTNTVTTAEPVPEPTKKSPTPPLAPAPVAEESDSDESTFEDDEVEAEIEAADEDDESDYE